MIVIEGPDGAGKTTLANRIANEYGLRVKQWETPDGTRETLDRASPRERTYTAITQAVGPNCPVIVHDRLFFSEVVYGTVLRGGKVDFSQDEQMYVLSMFRTLRVPVITCLPDFAVVQATVLREAEEGSPMLEGVVDHLDEIYGKYEDWVLPHSLMVWDYTQPDEEFLHGSIKRYLEFRQMRSW